MTAIGTQTSEGTLSRDAIRDALLEHHVLFFRDQALDDGAVPFRDDVAFLERGAHPASVFLGDGRQRRHHSGKTNSGDRA